MSNIIAKTIFGEDYEKFFNPTPCFFEGQFAENKKDERSDEEIARYEAEQEVNINHAQDNQI